MASLARLLGGLYEKCLQTVGHSAAAQKMEIGVTIPIYKSQCQANPLLGGGIGT